MINQTYFRKYCKKLFNDACEFKSAMVNDMEFHIKCYYNQRLVAKLYVDERMKTVVDVYTADQCSTSTRFKWRFRHLLKKYTYVDRHKADVIKEITKLVSSKFYAHSDDIWQLIDQVTDDVFATDVARIAEKLMDKSDIRNYGTIKWRTCNKERSKEG
jgi:phenylpyruvate tautomerase PptA (4-oxalocrotonate tautomerase family)